jgi:predicted dehydrogenase
VVAFCDISSFRIEQVRGLLPELEAEYADYPRMLEHDLDVVYVANYPMEHVPLVIQALKAGKHVLSEVMACKTLAEGVALARAVEEADTLYSYGENTCYYRPVLEMKRLFQAGEFGEFQYAECEYIHDVASLRNLSYTDPDHPSNWMAATLYCSHALGPILDIAGQRPVRVTGFTLPNRRNRLYGRYTDDLGILMCELESGALTKEMHGGGVCREPIMHWYSIYGTKGSAENQRSPHEEWLHVYTEHHERAENRRSYIPKFPYQIPWLPGSGYHGGIDAYMVDDFVRAVLAGGPPPIDVYRGLDMSLPGILGFRSALKGNVPLEVPDFRDESVRLLYADDHWSPDPRDPGPEDKPISPSAHGPIDIPPEVYEKRRRDTLGLLR